MHIQPPFLPRGDITDQSQHSSAFSVAMGKDIHHLSEIVSRNLQDRIVQPSHPRLYNRVMVWG